MVVRAIIKEDRYGNKVYVCPLCGHVFYSPKQFQKHLMTAHLGKTHRKKRIEKRIQKRGYVRRVSFGRPKTPEVVEERRVEKPVEKPAPKVTKEETKTEEEPLEELMPKVHEFINKRAKGKNRVRFKITTLARELDINIEVAKKLVDKLENAKVKGDRVTVTLE